MEPSDGNTEPKVKQPAAGQRPWIKPLFEKVALDKALSGTNLGNDAPYSNS